MLTGQLGNLAPDRLASQILKLSDFYNQNVGHPTPWTESFTRDAYLAYFLPLNFARLQTAFQEVKRFLPLDSIREIWDIGSGTGATHWVLENEPEFTPRPFFNIEASRDAILLHQELLKKVEKRG